METRSGRKNDGQRETERTRSDKDYDLRRPPIKQFRDDDIRQPPFRQSRRGRGDDYKGDGEVNRIDTVKKDKTLSSQGDSLKDFTSQNRKSDQNSSEEDDNSSSANDDGDGNDIEKKKNTKQQYISASHSNFSLRKGKDDKNVGKPKQRQAKDCKPRQEDVTDVTNQSKVYSDDEENQPVRGTKHQPVRGTKHQPVRGNHWLPILTVLALLLAIFLGWMLVLKKPSTSQAEKELQVMKTFQDGFRKLPSIFSGQSQDLWLRSQRILELQLRRGNENKEPAIILLTAAKDAEHMLHCVGNHLAKTYASTLNSSYTVLSGLEMTSENSEDVKMDIDKRLSAGFQANNKAAVLHRLELLPPGSLIILYKYCDHENAAFKNIALVLTMLLSNSTLQTDIGLGELEETVYDFLKETFIKQIESRTSHNEMDGDKLGGVWSRISHVVLPVFPGKHYVKE
ncbi:torsin-1A-interacting protein 1-like [Pyxicephalus adspersus]|uniref:Torsin-1A-interacting protein 1/2 AAA+ activator domain-containing protein n=1 Tax=Pyxicephalus adspersus TaxID=30357 RepID=A0AAV2ZTV1_PYXAD|nr:TPA: hypothetical protein GDO54_016329 [Pyxicephalus adspersus]